jgi:hypothetical protein
MVDVGSSAGSRPGGPEIYFSKIPGHGKVWVRFILLHDPAVG